MCAAEWYVLPRDCTVIPAFLLLALKGEKPPVDGKIEVCYSASDGQEECKASSLPMPCVSLFAEPKGR